MSEKNSSTIKLDKNSELRRSRRIKLFFVFLLFILLVLGGLVGFLRKKEFQISEVLITGTRSLDPDIILKTAHDYLNGHYAIIIPKTNTLLLSKGDLSEHILDQVPSITEAGITFTEKNKITINVTEKKPSYIWCTTECYFVDDTGMIYEQSPTFTQGIFITFSGGEVDDVPIKNHFVSDEEFTTTLKTLATLDQLKVHVLGVHFGTDITIHIDSMQGVQLGPETKLILSRNQNNQDIFDALSLITKDKVFTAALAAKGKLLHYIDIRFPDKIYYKFDTPAAEVATTPPPGNAKLLEKPQ